MKWLSFQLPQQDSASEARVGALTADGSRVVDLAIAERLRRPAASDKPPLFGRGMLAALDDWDHARALAAELVEFAQTRESAAVFPLREIRWLSPVPRPRSIRDLMLFEQHLVNSRRAVMRRRRPWTARLDRVWTRLGRPTLFRPPSVWYERPIYYKGNPASVVGHEADVRWPSFSKRLDYELEFGVFIGRPGCNIPTARAMEHVAGYCIFNDFSARDTQLREMTGWLGPAKGKDFDTGNAIGPWLVSRDEVPDPQDLEMTARVNGQVWSQNRSDGMRFSLAEAIAYISRDETLYPGDFIAVGTVGGGCGLEQDRWLQGGDVVELEVSRLGLLRNRIVRGGER